MDCQPSIFLTTRISAKIFKDGEKDQAGEKKRAIVVGPWGGNGGTNWDDGNYSGVREISLKYGRCIDSICVVYDKNGKPVSGEKHGGSGGGSTAEVSFCFISLSLFMCDIEVKIQKNS